MKKQINYYDSYNLPGDSLPQKQIEWMIWYSAVPERIANYYDEFLNTFSPRGGAANVKFWGNQNTEQNNEFVHLPIASDIAKMSANLLFSEPPEINFDTDNDRVQDTLKENKFGERIIHAAEIASAAGGVYLKADINDTQSEYPIITIRYPDCTIPSFRSNGDLESVAFHRLISEGKKQYRLYEKRYLDDGLRVEFELKKVKDGVDGDTVSLESTDQTSGLKNAYYPGFDSLGVQYIPNMLPNNQFPKSSEGVSDYAGCITLMDALDEAWTSWINDVTLGQGRALVDQEILDMEDGKFRFDPYKRVIMKADMSAANMGDGYKPIEKLQFAIRAQEHLTTCQNLTAQIIGLSGYSPQSFGMEIEGRAESGTALRIRERKSMLTKQKKQRYWMYGLQEFLYDMQRIDVESRLSSSYDPQRPSISFGDSEVRDPKEQSETIRNLDQARAVSTFMKVSLQNPDWDEDQIDEEVERINSEQGSAIPDPFSGG